MPQPLSRIKPEANVSIGNVGDHPLRRHPDLAALAAEVIASWANVESFMLRLFITMMGGETSRAATVFLALEGQSAKTAAINAIADTRLAPDARDLLRAILSISKSCQKERDKLAHCVWGDSPQLPNALLLMDPRSVEGVFLDASKISVYRSGDFKALITRNEEVASYGSTFEALISSKNVNEARLLYHELSSVPEIREKLDRQASRVQPQHSGSSLPPDAFHQNACDQDPEVPD